MPLFVATRSVLLAAAALAAWAALVASVALAALGVLGPTAPATAHGFTSTVYADLTTTSPDVVRAELELEYDLLVVSAADAADNNALFRDGTKAFENRDPQAQAAALSKHTDTVVDYLRQRFTIDSSGPCTPTHDGSYVMGQREGVPYVEVDLDYRCGNDQVATAGYDVRSALFADDEGYVKDTVTIVTYEAAGHSASAALDQTKSTFTTRQSAGERAWEFFRLGAEHLYGGLDHLLFLVALIIGSRRLREVVMVATTFTLAHSVTFVLAALGIVSVPGWFVEPVIALSIAIVAGWYLWLAATRRSHAADLPEPGRSHLTLDRTGWTRLAVVFGFGLIHGLGFAGALGINEPLSWTLLWSLLVFNLGIEAVQIGIILALFPLLAVLRHRRPTIALWVSALVSAGVLVMGLLWFFQRVLGLG